MDKVESAHVITGFSLISNLLRILMENHKMTKSEVFNIIDDSYVSVSKLVTDSEVQKIAKKLLKDFEGEVSHLKV